MIVLTTFKKEKFAVNPDLIEEIRAVGSGSSISLITGRTYSASEDIDAVCQMLVDYRCTILSSVMGDTNSLSDGDSTTTIEANKTSTADKEG